MTEPLVEMIPTIHLESMNGLTRIELDNTAGWIRMPGATGLEMAPIDIIASPIPGVAGSLLEEVRTMERPIFLPIYCRSAAGQRTHLQMLDELRALINPLNGGTFKIVGTTARGVRELIVTYTGGLEGADGEDTRGLSWCKVGLKATAHFPFARARTERRLEFRVVENATPFLGVVGGSDTPWPGMLSTNSVIGEGMKIRVTSEVPVYPTLELVGSMTEFAGTLSPVVTDEAGNEVMVSEQEWSVGVPAGVAGGSTLRLVTDPRARSIRLNGNLAAGLVARGASLRPFYPGTNVLDVVASGGTEDTRIILTWTDLFWSLW